MDATCEDHASESSLGQRVLLGALSESLLCALLDALQRRPDLAGRLRALCTGGDHVVARVVEHMSVAEYAAYRRVSERTVRYEIKEMTEGVHYHRAGRQRRRLVVRVQEADRWHAERAPHARRPLDIAQLAVDEVTRRRARAALTKRKERG